MTGDKCMMATFCSRHISLLIENNNTKKNDLGSTSVLRWNVTFLLIIQVITCPFLTLLRDCAAEEFSSNLASSWVAMERTLFSRSPPSSPAGGALWQDNWSGWRKGENTEVSIWSDYTALLWRVLVNLPRSGSCCPFVVSCWQNPLPVSCRPAAQDRDTVKWSSLLNFCSKLKWSYGDFDCNCR